MTSSPVADHETPSRGGRRRYGPWSKLAILLVATAGSLLVLEAGLRLLTPREEPATTEQEETSPEARDAEPAVVTPEYVASDELGWTLRPSSLQRFRLDGFDVTVRSNSLGLRGPEIEPKPPEVTRYAVLGDSYAFGWGVEESETYAAQLERLLNRKAERDSATGARYEVVNAALPGFGTYQRLQALNTVAPLGLDGVVIEFSASNDVVDDWRAAPYVPDRLGEYQARGTQFTAFERFLVPRSRLAALIWGRAMPFRLWLEARRGVNLRRTARLWDELLARAAELDLDVVVLVNASRYQLLGERGGNLSRLARTSLGRRPNQMIREVVERHHVPWVDGWALFRDIPSQDLFLGQDVHWTPEGHRAVASALAWVILGEGSSARAPTSGPRDR